MQGYSTCTYDGPTGVWNNYTLGYHRLAAEGARTSKYGVMIVEYENLVLDTEWTVRKIASFLNVTGALEPYDTPFHQIWASSKSSAGGSNNRSVAFEKVLKRTYMAEPPWTDPKNITAACRNLDTDMMKSHRVITQFNRGGTYGEVQNVTEERDYYFDCRRSFDIR